MASDHLIICYLYLPKQSLVGPSWSLSYGSWIYNYLCNQYLSPLMLWVRISLGRGVLNTTLCDTVCQWLAAGRWFSPGTRVFSINKTDHHDISEILLKEALNTINTLKTKWYCSSFWGGRRGQGSSDHLLFRFAHAIATQVVC